MNELILVADDEPAINRMVCEYLGKMGFRTVTAFNGHEALAVFDTHQPDLAILDIMMPGLDGIDVARAILRSHPTPIIFLTARVDETDRVIGLELGADDYVVKPFSPRELTARVKAVLRRSQTVTQPSQAHPSIPTTPESAKTTTIGAVCNGDLCLDAQKHQVTINGKPARLTATQFDILAVLLRHPGQVFTRLQILQATVGDCFPGYERTIDAHIKNIRKALGDNADHPDFIETLRGVGYRLRES